MLFNSFNRKIYLLVVSYLLYINFNAVYALILLGVTGITYFGGKFFGKQSDSKLLVVLLVLLSSLPLLVFKYYNFILEIVESTLSYVGLKFTLPGLNWAIPVGISFYTFQALGYMFDVYYKRCKAEKNILDYALFISFFPQIVSGPISKASELLPQIKSLRTFDYNNAVIGLRYLLWGIFMKVVVADRAGIYVDMIFNNYEEFSLY